LSRLGHCGPPRLRGSQDSPRRFGVVSGFLLKLIRESIGLTQVRLAERLGVDVATVQGWESGRRPLAALRVADLLRLRSRLLRCAAQPTALALLEDAIEADLVIGESVQAGAELIDVDEHPLGVMLHQSTLTNLIIWPFTGILPAELGVLPQRVRTRRGPVPDRPTITEEERTRFFDHLLVTADSYSYEDAALARQQAVYLLGFDTRVSTAEWLHVEQLRALRNAGRIDRVPSWVAVRSSAVALAYTGDRDPLATFVRQALITDRQEQANLNYWAYWVGEIESIQVDEEFMVCVDPRDWSGVRLLGHLLEGLHPGSAQAELDIHTVWALLLAQPAMLANQPGLRSATTTMVEQLAADPDLNTQTRRELSDIAYAVRFARR